MESKSNGKPAPRQRVPLQGEINPSYRLHADPGPAHVANTTSRISVHLFSPGELVVFLPSPLRPGVA